MTVASAPREIPRANKLSTRDARLLFQCAASRVSFMFHYPPPPPPPAPYRRPVSGCARIPITQGAKRAKIQQIKLYPKAEKNSPQNKTRQWYTCFSSDKRVSPPSLQRRHSLTYPPTHPPLSVLQKKKNRQKTKQTPKHNRAARIFRHQQKQHFTRDQKKKKAIHKTSP